MASEFEIQTHFEVDASEIDAELDIIEEGATNVFKIIGQRLRIEGRELLVSIFEEAISNLEEGQMGSVVQQALIRNVTNLPIRVIANSQGVEAEVDFESLGSRADLEAGFHYHALLTRKGFVELPYVGQEMHNETDTRYSFVEAMMNGEIFETVKGTEVDTDGLWEETQEARVAFWGDISPAWLYLEFGQEEWDPTIEPMDITGQFRDAFSELGSQIFSEEWAAVVERFEEYESFGAEETGFGSRYRVPAGEYPIINGKQYKPGQLIPKL